MCQTFIMLLRAGPQNTARLKPVRSVKNVADPWYNAYPDYINGFGKNWHRTSQCACSHSEEWKSATFSISDVVYTYKAVFYADAAVTASTVTASKYYHSAQVTRGKYG